MREDEYLIKREIEKYLRAKDSNFIEIVEGENPPDCYAKFKNVDHKIPLEITRAELKDHCNAILDFVDAIDRNYSSKLPEGIGILLNLYSYYNDFRKFKKQLRRIIEMYLDRHLSLPLNDFEEIDDIRIKLTNSKKSKIEGVIIPNSFEAYDIDKEVSELLSDCISKKEEKISAINGEKWLAIYNNFIISGCRNYKKSMKDLEIEHSFTKIFVVSSSRRNQGYETECIYPL